MTRISLLFAGGAAAFVLSACGGGLGDVGGIFSPDTATDAIGLPRAEPGAIVIDNGETTVATPYGGDGEAASSCPAVARDIARLTALLGPDQTPAEPEAEPEGEENASRTEQARDFGSDAVSRAPVAATDAARSAIVGLNPARPVVRFLGGASEIEAAARLEREIALKRRAWLRGAFDVQNCDPAILTEALDAYNLLLTPLDG